LGCLMKCHFYLLDINEDRWNDKPCVRLWGVDEKRRRVLVLAAFTLPYFYYVLDDGVDAEKIKLELESKARTALPEISEVRIELKKRLGRTRTALKISCNDTGVVSSYAKQLQKLFKGRATFEADLRLSVRYVTDSDLTPCGWNECEVQPVTLTGVKVDRAYVATSPPLTVKDVTLPKLRLLSFSVLTASGKGSAKPEKDPVRVIAVETNTGESKAFTCDGADDSKLLNSFVSFLANFDPDIILSFESNRLHWPYLIQRFKARRIRFSIGRDGSEPHTSMFGHLSITGRANVDLFDIAGSLPEVKIKTLENVAEFLQTPSSGKVTTIAESDRYALWSTELGRRRLTEHTAVNAKASLEVAEASLTLPMQLSAITGLPLDQVMTAAVGFRVDSYLMKQAHLIGELIPPRSEQPFFTYRGAIVLEPKSGLHDNVAVLDFASMYPNLMVDYNLSPDTLLKPDEQVPADSVNLIPEVKHRFRRSPDGFYKIVLSTLIKERSGISRELKEADPKSSRYKVLKERERAVKIVTNACYGYAGWAGARWYVREVAESAAALGRDTIDKTIKKAEAVGVEVIYGDTDSLFVKNEPNKIDQLLSWVKKEMGLEVRVEQIYVRVLFTEAMKRYAGLLPDGTIDIVGLEVVRGDWSDIARQVQEQVLNSILRDRSTEKAIERVRSTIGRLRAGEVPIADLTIWKTLTKPIEDYKVNAPHIEAAKRLLKEGWDLTLGDKVGYVITKGKGRLFEKARPYNQVRPQDVDTDYYMQNQVKPAAMRILERFGASEKQVGF